MRSPVVLLIGFLLLTPADTQDVSGTYGAWTEYTQDRPDPDYTVVISPARRGWRCEWRNVVTGREWRGTLQRTEAGYAEWGDRPDVYRMNYERHADGCLFDFTFRYVLRPFHPRP